MKRPMRSGGAGCTRKRRPPQSGPCRRLVLRGIGAAAFYSVPQSYGLCNPVATPSVTSRSEATFVSTHDRLRGVNIAEPFAYWQQGQPWNLARGWNVWLPPERLAAIASAQFEFIRICVDPAPLLAAETADALDIDVVAIADGELLGSERRERVSASGPGVRRHACRLPPACRRQNCGR